MTIEIVDLPINRMVILTIVFCKRLPEGSKFSFRLHCFISGPSTNHTTNQWPGTYPWRFVDEAPSANHQLFRSPICDAWVRLFGRSSKSASWRSNPRKVGHTFDTFDTFANIELFFGYWIPIISQHVQFKGMVHQNLWNLSGILGCSNPQINEIRFRRFICWTTVAGNGNKRSRRRPPCGTSLGHVGTFPCWGNLRKTWNKLDRLEGSSRNSSFSWKQKLEECLWQSKDFFVWFIPLFIEVQPSKVVQDFATIHSESTVCCCLDNSQHCVFEAKFTMFSSKTAREVVSPSWTFVGKLIPQWLYFSSPIHCCCSSQTFSLNHPSYHHHVHPSESSPFLAGQSTIDFSHFQASTQQPTGTPSSGWWWLEHFYDFPYIVNICE